VSTCRFETQKPARDLEEDSGAMNERRRSKAELADLAMIRADLLDVLKVCGIEPAGVMTFQDDLLAVTRYVRGLQDVVMAGPQRERTDIAAWLRRDSTAETEPAAWSYAAAIENGAHLAFKPRG
jgi:hypothetical protein